MVQFSSPNGLRLVTCFAVLQACQTFVHQGLEYCLHLSKALPLDLHSIRFPQLLQRHSQSLQMSLSRKFLYMLQVIGQPLTIIYPVTPPQRFRGTALLVGSEVEAQVLQPFQNQINYIDQFFLIFCSNNQVVRPDYMLPRIVKAFEMSTENAPWRSTCPREP